MTEEPIITAAVITSGDKNDGKQLPQLIPVRARLK